MAGSCSSAISPQTSGCVGTTRQVATEKSNSAAATAKASLTRVWLSASVDMNTMPTAKVDFSSRPKRSRARSRMKSAGIWSNKPHPSPVFPSAAIPPRCVIQVSDSMAVCSSLWLATPCWWAIMPKPQLSRNSSGLYKPRTSFAVPTVAFTMPDDFMSELARLIKLGLDAMNAQSQKGRTVYTSGPLSTICVTAK